MASAAIVVFCTCPDEVTAARIARELVESGVAACVNRLPGVRSTFRWEDKTQDEPEVLLLIKTMSDRYGELEQRLVALHPYEVPEIIAVPVSSGAPSYLSWLKQSVLHETLD
jgi:periplasmic divalent cation tolerance protein